MAAVLGCDRDEDHRSYRRLRRLGYVLANVNIKKLSLLLSDFRFCPSVEFGSTDEPPKFYKIMAYTIIHAQCTCISSSIQLT